MLSVQGRKVWWLVRVPTFPHALWPKSFNDKFSIYINVNQLVSSDRFYELIKKEDIDNHLFLALLNCSLLSLIIEINGRVNLGEGALDNMTYEAQNCLFPDYKKIQKDKENLIVQAYLKLASRPVKPIAQEVKQKDRQALDTAVLEALGLDPKRYLPQIYEGLVQMVNERLTLPKMRIDRKKKERLISSDQVKTKVQEELIPNGFKRISAFLSPGAGMIGVPLTGRPHSWTAFFTEYTLRDTQGKEVGMIKGTETQARYAIYASLPGQYRVEVPSDGIVAGKAVQQYEQYLQDEAHKLHQSLSQRTNDFQQSERMLKEILEAQGLAALAITLVMSN